MILGLTEDFSSDVVLDAQLTAIPSSGVFLNSGVHPSITVDNLLSFLPNREITVPVWDYTKSYNKYENQRTKSALASFEYLGTTKIYQSLQDDNQNRNPIMYSDYWLETNLESLRIKNFIDRVKDRILTDLSLTPSLINNQFLYEIGRNERMLPGNYSGYVFETKGSDYVTFKINQIGIQKNGTTPLNLYVINQGVLIDTLVLTPKNGRLELDDIDYTFSGKGRWYFVIDSTTTISNAGYVDVLKYDGVEVYTCTGIGNSPETAEYSVGNTGMGLGFNISVYLDSTLYVKNNLGGFSAYMRAAFEYMCFQMFLSNSNNRSLLQQRLQMNENVLLAETKDLQSDTAVYRYRKELGKAQRNLAKTFDTQIGIENGGLDIELTSI